MKCGTLSKQLLQTKILWGVMSLGFVFKISSHWFHHGLISSLLKMIKAIINFFRWYTRMVYRSLRRKNNFWL